MKKFDFSLRCFSLAPSVFSFSTMLFPVILFAAFLFLAAPVCHAQNFDDRDSSLVNPDGSEVEAKDSFAGFIVTEKLLLDKQHRVSFVPNKSYLGDTYVELTMSTSEGKLQSFNTLRFGTGLKQGEVINIFSGVFSEFQKTPWLKINVTVSNQGQEYYTSTRLAIGHQEQYKDPMVKNIAVEQTGLGLKKFTLEGDFDSYEQTYTLINYNGFISPNTPKIFTPGQLIIDRVKMSKDVMGSGLFLVTICQAWRCDTMYGRHIN